LAAQDAEISGRITFPSGNVSPDESAFVLGEATEETGSLPVSSGFVVFRMVLALALVAAAVYGVVFFIRRASRPQERRNSHLKVLTSAHLGSNRFVHVVHLGNQAWLLGAGEGGVSLIAEVTDKEVLDTLLLEDSQRQAEGGRIPDFGSLLSRFGGGRTSGGELPPENTADNVRKNRERLRGL
jgi:flagellar protein FliO/FliZ